MYDRLTRSRLATPGLAVAALVLVAVVVFVAVRHIATPGMADIEIPATVPAAEAPNSLNYPLLYERRVQGVVTIEAQFPGGPAAASGEVDTAGGTGFVVDADGYILTSSHVVIDYYRSALEASAIFVEFAAGDRVVAKLVGKDYFNDVALLKVDPDEVDLHPVPLGDSDRVAIGEPVAAIGAPFGNEASLTRGIVSARRSVNSKINQKALIADAIQTDAAINRGNSGGPVFNARGEVIGIAQQINTTSGSNTGVSFAIPINTAVRAMRMLREDGRARWAHLGIKTEDVTPQMARRFQLPVTRGAIVQAVTPNSPAASVLRASGPVELFLGDEVVLGDIVTRIAGAPVRTKDDVTRIVSRIDVGASVPIEYYRDGVRGSAELVAGEKPVN